MTRIFDALRKAGSASARTGSSAPPAVVPLPPAPARAAHPVAERPPGRGDEVQPAIVPFSAPVELPADVVRELTGLRVSLEVALTERIPRIVMFLASQGGEGTSTVAAQFAQTLANDPRLRVLLVDAHARRPRYGPSGTPATARHAAAPAGGERPVARNLDLLPLPEALRQERMLSPQAMRDSLAAVASRYDWIVLDGPAALESPDAAPLGEVADGIVVVVQAGRTKRPVLTRSVDLLRRAGGRVLGIVLNRRRLEIPGFIYRRL
jgi:Mrp family chromosome partitioning ATPase